MGWPMGRDIQLPRTLLEECESRLRHGVPLRLDQQVGLLSQGYDVGAIEELINEEEEG